MATHRKPPHSSPTDSPQTNNLAASPDQTLPQHNDASLAEKLHLPHMYNHNGHRVTKGIKPDGESGRGGFHPLHFAKIVWKSSCTASKWVNVLWPFVPAAMVLVSIINNSDNY